MGIIIILIKLVFYLFIIEIDWYIKCIFGIF